MKPTETKFVIVERQNMSGRYVAMRGLSFATEAEAQAHLATLWNRSRCFVEPRKVKPANLDQRMTCQCCGREILANTGTIAHHGYERPGYGWQTNSCMGAKYLPFEVSRDRLGDLIHALKNHRTGLKFNRAKVAAEAAGYPVVVTWTERNPSVRGGHLNRSFDFTRVNFDDPGNEAKAAREHISYRIQTFDALLAHDLEQRDRQIKMIESDIADHEKRYAGWSITHYREGGEWKPIFDKGVAS